MGSIGLALKAPNIGLENHLELFGRLELTAQLAAGIGRSFGISESDMQLIMRGTALQLIDRVYFHFLTNEGLTVGEYRMSIDYTRQAVEMDGTPTVNLDPRKSIYGQISKALVPAVAGMKLEAARLGGTRVEVAVTYADDVRFDEERMNMARRVLGTSPSGGQNWAGDPVVVGSLRPGKLSETEHRMTLARPRKKSEWV